MIQHTKLMIALLWGMVALLLISWYLIHVASRFILSGDRWEILANSNKQDYHLLRMVAEIAGGFPAGILFFCGTLWVIATAAMITIILRKSASKK